MTMPLKAFLYVRSLLLLLGLAMTSGCSLGLDPLTKAEIRNQSSADIRQSRKNIEPLQGELTLNEAIARGLKYNLDYRVKQYEQAVETEQLDLAHLDMLPKLVSNAGYYARNNFPITTYKSIQPGVNPSDFISTNKQIFNEDLTFSWNILDFGASYFNARQQGNRVMIALERRRKAAHNLVQDIRTAYLRAYASQLLQGIVDTSIREAEQALESARIAEKEKLRSPIDNLKSQRIILDNLRILSSVQQELSTARHELIAYINMPPSWEFKLADPGADMLQPRQLELSAERLEDIAIANNADLREQIYNARIVKDEVKKNMLKLFPSLPLTAGQHYNSNTFLVNKLWFDVAVQASYNLVSIFSLPAQLRANEQSEKLFDQKRQALLMALVTQVHVSRLQYENAYLNYQRSHNLLDVDERVQRISLNRVRMRTQGMLDHVVNNTFYIVSLLRRYDALSQVYAAEGKLRSTLGQEIGPDNFDRMSVEDLARVVGDSMKTWLAEMQTEAQG